MPRVSVIIPTYNRIDLVTETVDSALNQSLVDREVIVVDDGSTDGTREHLAACFGDRIRILCQTNHGRSAARNRGIVESRGEFVVFLDSDDLLKPDALMIQSSFLDSHPTVGVAYSDGYYCDEAGRDLERISSTRPPLRGRNLLESLVLDNLIIAPHSAMVRRTCLDAVGAPWFDEELSVGEDSDFWIRLARAGCSFRNHNVVTCKYRIHSDSTYGAGKRGRHVKAFARSLHKIFASDYFVELSPATHRAFLDSYLLRYLAVDSQSQQQLFDSPNFALLSDENRAMALYFVGVKNIIDERLPELGRDRLTQAIAIDPQWKYRIVYSASHLGTAVLRTIILARRRVHSKLKRHRRVSPVYAQLLQYWREEAG